MCWGFGCADGGSGGGGCWGGEVRRLKKPRRKIFSWVEYVLIMVGGMLREKRPVQRDEDGMTVQQRTWGSGEEGKADKEGNESLRLKKQNQEKDKIIKRKKRGNGEIET